MSSKEKNFGTYKIGTIVTLKSNHLKSKEQFQEILLAGEPNFITPLMIVSEILKIKTDKIDEETGVIKNLKGNYQYKCIWFSSKSFKIEEQWFYENELIHIVNNEESKNIDSESQKFSFGDNLVLKTNRLELQKRKMSKLKSSPTVSSTVPVASSTLLNNQNLQEHFPKT